MRELRRGKYSELRRVNCIFEPILKSPTPGVPYSVDMGRAYNNASAESDFETAKGYYGCNPLPIVENDTVVEQVV